MVATAFRILMIGKSAPSTHVTLARLAECGWGSYAAPNVRDGQELLKTFQVDVVLATESLPDGRGYDLADCVARQLGSLLVGVALSENALWLPVIHRGHRVLGTRAIGSRMLEAELISELTSRALVRGASAVTTPPLMPTQAGPQPAGRRRRASSAA